LRGIGFRWSLRFWASKTAVWKWVRKFSERVNVKPSRIVRRLIALDETCVKVNGLEYWVYAALDVDRNEIISMRKNI